MVPSARVFFMAGHKQTSTRAFVTDKTQARRDRRRWLCSFGELWKMMDALE